MRNSTEKKNWITSYIYDIHDKCNISATFLKVRGCDDDRIKKYIQIVKLQKPEKF